MGRKEYEQARKKFGAGAGSWEDWERQEKKQIPDGFKVNFKKYKKHF